MFKSRFEFYRSREWARLTAQLKQERLDSNGNIICEHCGQPIVKAYDCIGHHKTELTEDNVNDYNISLNPENIALVHMRCHNEIHHKGFARGTQEVFIVYGAPLSGKTTYVNSVKSAGDLIIDIDNIWQCLTGADRYVKPDELKPVVFDIRNRLFDAIRYRLGKWRAAYIIGGYPLSSERERLAQTLGAREIFIEATQAECLDRLAIDDSGRDKAEWKKYIDDWFERFNR